jgi:CheY-like chemotaxis protein/AraC-like DNA-binding protein
MIPRDSTPAPGKELFPPRILIIDDNQSIHRDFELVFQEEEPDPELAVDAQRLYGTAPRPLMVKPAYHLDHALSGTEGIEKVKLGLAAGQPYQLAFVDIRMPGIDGVETIERLWQLDPRIQMVICTAYADYSQEDLARRLGFTDKLLVLKKPFDSIEVTQLAITLTEKWYLAIQASLKLEQMELLVAQRTQRMLALQRRGPDRLPEPTSAAEGGAGPTGAEAKPPETELPLVLLVGDQDHSWQGLCEGLAGHYRVLATTDGKAGLDLAREQVPDLILATAEAEGLNGLELCRRLKGDELTSHIPVVLLAAHGSEQQQLRAVESGADDFLVAPPSIAMLRARLASLLSSESGAKSCGGHNFFLNPRELATNQVDVQFLRRITDLVERHISDFEFDVEALSQKMFMSRRQLFRKLKGVAGCAPNVFIRNLRLKRAAQLLKESRMTVTEITYAVGFSDLKHFRAIFKEHFGVLPGDYGGETKPL